MERVSPSPSHSDLNLPHIWDLSPNLFHFRKIPFILMTNGGGVQEGLRARMLSHELNFSVSETIYLLVHMFHIRDGVP